MTLTIPAPRDVEEMLEGAERLRDWLQTKQPTERVGICQDPAACVVANWLYETTGHEYVGVGTYKVDIGTDACRGYRTLCLPHWATRFIHAVDNFGRNGFVTAEAALALLAVIAEEDQ